MLLDHLSDEMALSPYYLIWLLHRIYQQSPHQHLIPLRITEAIELLSSSDLSMTKVCTDVDVKSLGSFSAQQRRGQTSRKSVSIPLCVCFLHGVRRVKKSNFREVCLAQMC
jgi:AraC-like DNA-binding protein